MQLKKKKEWKVVNLWYTEFISREVTQILSLDPDRLICSTRILGEQCILSAGLAWILIGQFKFKLKIWVTTEDPESCYNSFRKRKERGRAESGSPKVTQLLGFGSSPSDLNLSLEITSEFGFVSWDVCTPLWMDYHGLESDGPDSKPKSWFTWLDLNSVSTREKYPKQP